MFDGTFSFGRNDVVHRWLSVRRYMLDTCKRVVQSRLTMVIDACHSGAWVLDDAWWASAREAKADVTVFAACAADKNAMEATKDHGLGGYFTLSWCQANGLYQHLPVPPALMQQPQLRSAQSSVVRPIEPLCVAQCALALNPKPHNPIFDVLKATAAQPVVPATAAQWSATLAASTSGLSAQFTEQRLRAHRQGVFTDWHRISTFPTAATAGFQVVSLNAATGSVPTPTPQLTESLHSVALANPLGSCAAAAFDTKLPVCEPPQAQAPASLPQRAPESADDMRRDGAWVTAAARASSFAAAAARAAVMPIGATSAPAVTPLTPFAPAVQFTTPLGVGSSWQLPVGAFG